MVGTALLRCSDTSGRSHQRGPEDELAMSTSLLPVDEGFRLDHTPKRGTEVPKLCAQALGPLLSPPPLDQTG